MYKVSNVQFESFEFSYIVFMTNVFITILENIFLALPILLFVRENIPPVYSIPLTSTVPKREKKERQNIKAIQRKLGSRE